MRDRDTTRVAYLCLQATVEGQASYAHVHEIVNGLREQNIEVDLFEPGYEIQSGEAKGPLARLWEFRRVQRRLADVLPQYDVLYVRSHALALPSARRASRAGIPVVQECNGTYADFSLAWPASRPFAPLLRWMARQQYVAADALITVADELASWLRAETGRDDVAVISNAANTEVFRPGIPRPDGLPERYAVFFGSLAVWQGIETILAAAHLPTWPPQLSLVIIGDGARRAVVERAASELANRIVYLGRLGYRATAAVVCGAELSLVIKDAGLASKGLSPLKLYESMAAGVPVVASDAPNLSSVVRDADCGIIVPAGSPELVADAVLRLAENPEVARTLGANGRAAAVAKHSWRSRAEQTAAVIRQAAKSAGTVI